jgi:hypothetical protein
VVGHDAVQLASDPGPLLGDGQARLLRSLALEGGAALLELQRPAVPVAEEPADGPDATAERPEHDEVAGFVQEQGREARRQADPRAAARRCKLAVIALTDGRVTDTGAAAVFFVVGVVLLLAGAAAPAMRVLKPRRWWTGALALASALPLFGLSFALLDAVAKAIVGDAGPAWLEDEAGILAMGITWKAAGVAILRSQNPVAVRQATA